MRFVVVGGGVAGLCCAEELCRLRPGDAVTLVSASRVLKARRASFFCCARPWLLAVPYLLPRPPPARPPAMPRSLHVHPTPRRALRPQGVSVVARLSRNLEELAIVERRLDELPFPNLTLVQDTAAGIDTAAKVRWGAEGGVRFAAARQAAGIRPAAAPCRVLPSSAGELKPPPSPPGCLAPWRQELLLGGGGRLPYDKLCICAGARPKQLPPGVFQAPAAAAAAPAAAEEAEPHGGGGEQQAQQAQRDAELAEVHARVLTIRDTDSVARLAARLRAARRVAVVGNGGIALELM